MRLLLDTHILLPLVEERRETLPSALQEIVRTPEAVLYGSVVSLWEIAIKVRLGKLRLRRPLLRLPESIQRLGLALLVIEASHAVAEIDPLPATRDPFDRLLLSQCLVEGLRLVTLDRALAPHPLAWRLE